MIKIAIVDDNFSLVQQLKTAFQNYPEIEIIFTAYGGEECINILGMIKPEKLPDVLLVDVSMPEMSGIETIKKIKEKYLSIEAIIFTVVENDDEIIEAIKAGAKGYLLKTEQTDFIVQAITSVKEGESQISPSIARKILTIMQKNSFIKPSKKASDSANDVKLTKREVEILEYMRQGYSYQRTSEALFIEFSTIKKHIRNIYVKLEVNNKIEALNKLKKM